MKRVRILLRVSSSQQLDGDGDLSLQRRLVQEYVASHKDWLLDEKEYYEGSNSGYKNAVSERAILQAALTDAEKHEYDILAAYKDDRIGRRMWEIGAYVMRLKSCGVDIYTVKDGCISPENDDIMGQMMLALRYGNAQKSSSDTGMRVKDTAQKLIQQGKFMGGTAPYGYRLIYSGELSKHGRALHKLEIIPERAKAVKYIYHLSCYQELGSVKIAKLLNEDIYYQSLAPNSIWKAGTISSILKNPIYAGYTAYKRREHVNGAYHRLDINDWIMADMPNQEIQIIEPALWNKTQDKRKRRADKYRQTSSREADDTNIITRNDAMLPLIDVIYCALCGKKMTNGTKYHYWRIKGSSKKRSKKVRAYCCRVSQNDAFPHPAMFLDAGRTDHEVLECLAEYVERLQKKQSVSAILVRNYHDKQKILETACQKLRGELEKTSENIHIMQEYFPEAIGGSCELSVSEIAAAIHRLEEKRILLKKQLTEKEAACQKAALFSGFSFKDADIPSWRQVFLNADKETQRALVSRLVERIEIDKEHILIRFRINEEAFSPE